MFRAPGLGSARRMCSVMKPYGHAVCVCVCARVHHPCRREPAESQEPKSRRAEEPKSRRAEEPKSRRAEEPKSRRALGAGPDIAKMYKSELKGKRGQATPAEKAIKCIKS